MTTDKMNIELSRKEFDKIIEVINDFPDARQFTLEIKNPNTIGACLDLIIYTKIEGRYGDFRVGITGPDEW